MSRKKKFFKAQFYSHIYCVAYEVRAFNSPVQIIAIFRFDKIKAVIARRNDSGLTSKLLLLAELNKNRIQ